MLNNFLFVAAGVIGFVVLEAKINAEPKRPLRIQLEVNSKDDPDILRNYFEGAIRAVPDLAIVTDDPDFTISCIAVSLKRGETTEVYALSVVVTGYLVQKAVRYGIALGNNPGLADQVSHLVTLEDHEMRTCAPDQLQSAVPEMVTGINGDTFEKGRLSLENLPKLTPPSSSPQPAKP
jgi:hypothetical protein